MHRRLVALLVVLAVASCLTAHAQDYAPPSDGFSNVAVSSTTTYRSRKLSLVNMSQASAQLIWTGTPTGTFTIWVSNKPTPSDTTDTEWTQLSLAVAITQPAGSASNDFVDLSTIPARWVRVRYVNASGSGNIQAWLVSKGG